MSAEDAPDPGVSPQIQVTVPQSPVRHVPAVPKKSMVIKLWDVLQPLARLWGLITAVGES